MAPTAAGGSSCASTQVSGISAPLWRQARNLTPEHLNRVETEALTEVCDRALGAVIRALAPAAIVGIGRCAERRAAALVGAGADVRYLIHPSPANPLANRDWPTLAEQALKPWLPPRK